MIKIGLLAGLISAMSVGVSATLSDNLESLPTRDTRIIVEVEQPLTGLTESEIYASQNAVYRTIYASGIKNIRLIDRFHVLNNAFCLSVNSEDVSKIKEVPGVKSVTIDTIHWKQTINNDDYIQITRGTPINPDEEEENISATTMNKPTNTNDGEGTVVAILDNEFYFKGKTGDGEDKKAWNHESFTELDEDVAVRFTFDNLTSVLKKTNAKRKSSKLLPGEEGSLYFNNKVPFYYDYGGRAPSYGKDGVPDYDVHSEIDYHGSHVSSITAANGPYKGIAPKAQLACMKVFTEYKVDATGEGLGFGTYSGGYDMPILHALEDCITLGVDGINMSLGSDLNDFDLESITLRTLTKLANEGIMSAISAGNAGKASYAFTGGYGNWTNDMVETGILGSYANCKETMSVAAGEPDQVFYETALKIGGKNIAYDDQIVNREGMDADYAEEHRIADLNKGDSPITKYIYVGGFGQNGDYSGKDVSGKIAIVNRGSTSFADKYTVARGKGAAGLIIINNDPTASDFNFRCDFGGTQPDIPVAIVLFKDKPKIEAAPEGTFEYITKEVSDNEEKYTVSSYSSDGAAFDLDLKPDITAPGSNIKGAVPPQKKEDKEETPLSTYQYLSGTSMAAPNYAGAQSVVLSEKAAPLYQTLSEEKTELTTEEKKEIADYRKTVDMRIMSTANPMTDFNENPEVGGRNYTSPRLQGAGMVDIEGALKTEVYLESNEQANKSKVCLKNNEDIAKGDLKIDFKAHNESEATKTYTVKLTVMRPAIKSNNDIVTKDYNYRSEISDLSGLPGINYYWVDGMRSTGGRAAYKDAFKVSKQLEYWPDQASWQADHNDPDDDARATSHTASIILEPDIYYNNATNGINWVPLPDYAYQSVQDTIIYQNDNYQTVQIAAGDSAVSIDKYSIAAAVKQDILEKYPYGCPIEGFVELIANDSSDADLSIPFLGFYSGTDFDENASYESAPVAEPFSFEKNDTTVYPSDLVNDVANSLVGKANADMGSMWVYGYFENTQDVNVYEQKVLTNDMNWEGIPSLHKVGIDPLTGKYLDNPGQNIYVGNPETSNTMIIQQFMLRSVSNNFFTIKNKTTGEVVYKSVLEDMLFGDQMGIYPLYKSHVEANYLGAGYIAHRAYAVIPLYDVETGVAFASGEYELEFNYLLAGTGTWVSKAYDFNIDSDSPVISNITHNQDEGKVRIDVTDTRLSYGVLGHNLYEVEYDADTKNYFLEVSSTEFANAIRAVTGESDNQRLYIQFFDMSAGVTGAVVHFADHIDFDDLDEGYIDVDEDINFSNFEMIQGSTLKTNNDFSYDKNYKLSLLEVDAEGNVEEVKPTCELRRTNIPDEIPVTPAAKGCGGSVVAPSLTVFVTLTFASVLLALKRARKTKKEN